MTTGKTKALTRWMLIGKEMSLLFNMLSRLVITFLPRSKHLLIAWLQSPCKFFNFKKYQKKKKKALQKTPDRESGNSLVGQWLGFQTFAAKAPGSIPGQGTKIPQAAW